MNVPESVITGLGVVSPCGIGKEGFWQSLSEGHSGISEITLFDTSPFKVTQGGEVKNFEPKKILGPKGLRNLDRSTLSLLVATHQVLEDSGIQVDDKNTDAIGICTGTTFSHLWSVVEFDREVFTDGLNFSNPALFPSTVINAASSQASIRFNIQGFNTTISTGYTSGLEALQYSREALSTKKANIVLSGSVDALSASVFFGFHKLGYMGGLKGIPLSCPFDKRRNGMLLGEGAVMLAVETEKDALKRGVKPYAKIRGAGRFFDSYRMGKIHPKGEGLEKAIVQALDEAGVSVKDIDYISSSANSDGIMDRIEVDVLSRVFGGGLKKIPVSSIKSMLGETFSAAGGLQVASVIGAMKKGEIPPTINYLQKDPQCDIDCVPNQAQKKEVKYALVTSFGPGGYNSACIIEKYT